MAKYKMVRLPLHIFERYKGIKLKMESDITKFSGKHIPMTMPKVFDVVANPQFNRNWIEVELRKLTDYAKQKRRRYG